MEQHNKEQVVKKSLLRHFLEDVWNKLREHVVSAVAASVIALLILLWLGLRDLTNDLRNITREEALSAARVTTIGAKTIDAIPFRNRDRDEQYIAVIADDPEVLPAPPRAKVFLLEGSNGVFQVRDTKIYAYNRSPSRSVNSQEITSSFGVIDIDEDGNKEVYAVYGGGGSAAYGVTIGVYDSITGEIYSLTYGGEYGSVPNVNLSKNASRKKGVSTWLSKMASERMDKENGDVKSYVDEIQTWQRNNGKGFYKGQIRIQEFKGQIPTSGSILCKVDDGNVEWVSYFKGALFGYDKSQDVHFVVYVPWTVYSAVPSMIAGKQYLWLGITMDNGILALDKKERKLEVITVPELRQQLNSTERQAIDNTGNLEIDSKGLYFGNTLLTLPSSINFETEFKNYAGCEQ